MVTALMTGVTLVPVILPICAQVVLEFRKNSGRLEESVSSWRGVAHVEGSEVWKNNAAAVF